MNEETSSEHEVIKAIDEVLENESEIKPFKTDVKILQKPNIDVTEKELKVINDIMYLVDKRSSKNEVKAYR